MLQSYKSILSTVKCVHTHDIKQTTFIEWFTLPLMHMVYFTILHNQPSYYCDKLSLHILPLSHPTVWGNGCNCKMTPTAIC